ncbi:hypothetical protein [Hoeflea sp.]|uniref:hypothetical protein n=1 Tax=Hoeflea sp. TaxID=1940281 RepID=UPI003B52EE99
MSGEWDGASVKRALINALETMYATSGRVAPKSFGSAMPEYRVDAVDLWEQRRAETNSVGRMTARVQRTAREVTRMEIVLLGHTHKGKHVENWLSGFLKDQDGMRNCLVAWATWEVFNKNSKKECRKRGWAYSTFRSRRDRGAEVIAHHLNRLGIESWY